MQSQKEYFIQIFFCLSILLPLDKMGNFIGFQQMHKEKSRWHFVMSENMKDKICPKNAMTRRIVILNLKDLHASQSLSADQAHGFIRKVCAEYFYSRRGKTTVFSVKSDRWLGTRGWKKKLFISFTEWPLDTHRKIFLPPYATNQVFGMTAREISLLLPPLRFPPYFWCFQVQTKNHASSAPSTTSPHISVTKV